MLKVGKKILIGTLSLSLLLAGAGMFNVSTASAAGGPGGQGGGQGGQGSFMPWWMMGMGGQGQSNMGNHFGQGQNNQFNQGQNNQMPMPFGQGQNNQMQFNQGQNNQFNQGQNNQMQFGQGGMNQTGGDIISQVADIINDADEDADVDVQDILDVLKDGDTLAEIASSYGVDEDDLIDELVAVQTEAINNSNLSDEQKSSLLENLETRLTEMVENDNSQMQNNQMQFGQQPGGQYGQGGMNQVGGNIISQVADIINDADEDADVDVQDILDALKDGDTLAEIAESYGIDEDDLIDSLVELQTDAINNAASAGTITSEQQTTLLENLETRLTEMVENTASQASTLVAPTNLDADAVDTDEIDLTWSSVSDATSYYVYRADSYSGDYEKIDEVTDNSYEDTGLDEGTTYYYKVQAVNDDGVSGYSKIVHATTDDE